MTKMEIDPFANEPPAPRPSPDTELDFDTDPTASVIMGAVRSVTHDHTSAYEITKSVVTALRARSSAGIVEATKLAANMAKILYNGATLDDCPEEQKNAWIAAAQKLMEIYDVRQRDVAQRSVSQDELFEFIDCKAVDDYAVLARIILEKFDVRSKASPISSTPRECGLCGGPLPCLTHRQGLPPSPQEIASE